MKSLLFILLIYPGLPVIASCAAYLIFWRTARSSGHLSELDRLSGGRTGLWIAKALLSGCLSSCLLILLFPLHFLRRFRHAPEKAPKGPPVILVHGLHHNTSAWTVWAGRFAARGLSDIHRLGYESCGISYWEIVGMLEEEAARILEGRPEGTRIVLVGHSLGGLTIRGWLSRSTLARRVLAVVTLGAPHHGSKMSRLGISGLTRSLAHQGRLIQEIEAGEKEPPCPALSIYSPTDEMVIPAENLRIAVLGWQESAVPPMSHVSMLYSWVCAGMAAEFIERAMAGESPRQSRP